MTSASESRCWFFVNYFLSQKVSEEEMHYFRTNSENTTCKRNEFIFMPGENNKSIYFIKQGYVKTGFYDDDGKEVIIDILQAGDVFGSLHRAEEFSQKRDFAQALSDVDICEMKMDVLFELLSRRPDLSIELLKTVSDRLHKLERKVILLAIGDARTRILEFLKEFATDYGRVCGSEIHVENFLTHAEISNLAATSRQMVSTLFNQLRDQGMLEYDRRHIVIKVPLDQLTVKCPNDKASIDV